MERNIILTEAVDAGNTFSRLQPVLISPVKASVEVLATSAELSAKPGHAAQGDFLVTNFGLESDFNITGTDSGKFLQYMEPAVYVFGLDSREIWIFFSLFEVGG